MASRRERHEWMERLLGHRAGMPPAASDDCLDAETLAAWVDGGLGGKDLTAAEVHASSCPRCTALVASMVRTAPVPDATSGAHGRRLLLRWLVPLAATATAVAIWVAIPEPQVARVEVEKQAVSPSVAMEPPAALPAASPPSDALRSSPKDLGDRADSLRSTPATEVPGAVREERAQLADAPAAETRTAAAPPAVAAEAPAQALGAAASDKVAEPLRRTLLQKSNVIDAVAPDSTIRWRVLAGVYVERSSDGGQSWVRTSSPAGVIPNSSPQVSLVGIRAVDALRATVTTSTGTTFTTTNGGETWTPVQESPAAPF